MTSIFKAKDTLVICFVNKNYQKRTIFCYIRKGVTIFDVKKALLHQFLSQFRPSITDFRLVSKGKDSSDMNDTLKDNFFEEKYNEKEAYDILRSIKDSDYYKTGGVTPSIYFRTIKLLVNTRIHSPNQSFGVDYELAIENNSYIKWENSIKEKAKKYIKNIDDLPFHPFQNTKNLDDISKEEDMKKYSKHGLVLYLYPIQAMFTYNHQRTSILLKFDIPLSDYLTEITKKWKIKLDIQNIQIRIKKDTNTFEEVDVKCSVHKILKRQKVEPVMFDILDISPHMIHITVPYNDGDPIDINFEYKNEKTINDLTKSLKSYFNIENIKLLQDNTSEAKGEIKKFQSLLLNYSQTSNLSLTRTFHIINKKEKEPKIMTRNVLLDKKVIFVMEEIAKEFKSHKSLVTIKIDEKAMDPHSFFASYFIPPEKEILVEIQDFSEFITIQVNENNKTIDIRAGFTPKMKIKSLRNLKEFNEKVPSKLQADLFFFFNEKLDETKTFKECGITNNQIIKAYASKFYIYKYKGQVHLISADTDFDELKGSLKSYFKLPDDHFHIDYNGKPLTPKSYLTPKLQNGTMFEIIAPTEMLFEIDNKYKVKANSNQQVKDIIAKLSKDSKTPAEKIQLFNEQGKPVRPDFYLYSSFIMKEQGHIYKIQSKKAMNFSFQNKNGKFFNASFLPSMKIGDVLTELRNDGKKIDDKSFIIFMGQVIDNNETLASLIPNKKDEDEEDEDQILIIENEIPELINIKLIFKFGKESEDIEDYNIKLTQPTEVMNVHYWASVTCGQPFDMLSLAANDSILNDSEMLENDTDVIVTLCSSSGSDQMEEQLQDALKQTASYISKKIDAKSEMTSSLDLARTQKISEIVPKKVTESSDESELDDFSDEEDTDPFAKGNGTYGPTPNGPEDEYIFKFKIINGEDFDLQLPRDISVKDIKEKIAESRDTEVENITIFAGNQRLADFNRLTNLYIPKQVKYFSVKIIDLKNTLVCTRVRLRK